MSNTIEYAQKLGEIIKSNESSGFNEEEQFLENISSRRRRRANAFHVDSDFEDALDVVYSSNCRKQLFPQNLAIILMELL